ncbi:MAG: N-acetylglucosaminyldiphosphoundecaprenol N-acetyl-beta-D-mannosaminyltransferase [Chroococcopsis gigantea SAG 12.99]|jgi:N-acetylglucosaminyldiphosphoundecaprenol N-acetyl-beta-D-mannosaminyltransferase|nr:WecB/TagA/CpsF family glycosyltransferase [Chlorogloea purpurea SAG 13.99]MDV3000548.1 N-acetylglucosaminyldiphosphoundecaprenol N-acetyl-beta-D-mannosaminyltransferase [Chroococcopsis gigantea SAG 12.99]
MIKAPEKSSVLGLPIHLLDNYSQWLLQRQREGHGAHVVTLNAEMAMLGEKNPQVAEAIKEADLVIPDGAGVVIYLGIRGKKQQRCPGIELAESLIEGLARPGELIAFYGGKPGVADLAADKWRDSLPGVSIITNHGYLSDEEQCRWLEVLSQKQPRLILVGLGVPRQEYWIRQHRHLCPGAIWIGVGGSFDVWSGLIDRAPRFFRDNHLEWFYRLYQEPWRWRRMLVLPLFFLRSFLH